MIDKKLFVSVGIGLLIAICASFMSGFAKECVQIRESVLRLHILANSDSQEDQALKLSVRDRILAQTQDLFYQVTSTEDAKETAQENLEKIIAIAQREIARQGYDYQVNAEVCNMFFDTRVYDNFSLPAGRYDAVRITIGEAKGKNWWCVLYPPMCLPCAMPESELEENLTSQQAEIIEKPQHYKVQFAVIEIWEKIKNLFQS